MNQTIDLLKSHRSIRRFKDIPMDESIVKEIIQCGQSSSTSSFMQAYSIVRVKNQETRKKMAHLCGDQAYIEKCPLFLVFCGDLWRLGEAVGDKTKMDYTELFIVATVDATIAAQNVMIASESMGLGGVYIGGIRNNPEEICSLLELPEKVYPIFGMCIGYPDQDPEVKPKLPSEVVLKEEKYSQDNKETSDHIKQYDNLISEYYLNRTKGKRGDTWTEQMKERMNGNIRPHMKEFLEGRGFLLK